MATAPTGAFDLGAAQTYLGERNLDGWLLEDFHQNNPIFWQVVGGRRHTTRRAFLFIPPRGTPRFLLHMIDAERLSDLGWTIQQYLSRTDQETGLRNLLADRHRVAMEYSPDCALPVVSRVDAGTIEQVRALGVEVVSSGDVLQYAVARWSPAQLQTHLVAAKDVVNVAREAFQFIGRHLAAGVDELAVRDFIRRRFAELGLETSDGPAVAANEHSGDPHYEPSPATSRPIKPGDWVLIDLWAKQTAPGAIFGDTTWVAYIGKDVPETYRAAFDVVRRARDAAVQTLEDAWKKVQVLEGWQVDAVARQIIGNAGYGRYFTHRLGHSIGESIHSNGVNLDGFETHDTRQIIPGLGFSVEPGIYLPEFGVRLEIDVYVDQNNGPTVTTPPPISRPVS
jgi:Xaa-Pro aminopeptidase